MRTAGSAGTACGRFRPCKTYSGAARHAADPGAVQDSTDLTGLTTFLGVDLEVLNMQKGLGSGEACREPGAGGGA